MSYPWNLHNRLKDLQVRLARASLYCDLEAKKCRHCHGDLERLSPKCDHVIPKDREDRIKAIVRDLAEVYAAIVAAGYAIEEGEDDAITLVQIQTSQSA